MAEATLRAGGARTLNIGWRMAGREVALVAPTPAKSKVPNRAGTQRQNGLTITMITMTIINNVGISLTIRQWRAGFSLRSSANFLTAAER